MSAGLRVVGIAGFCMLLMATCGFAPSISQSIGSDVIVTATPAYEPLAAVRGGERFPRGAHLLLIHDGNAEPLVPEFASSADASLSFDGGSVLFAGKKTAVDPWQIWELTLADRRVRQVVSSTTDAIRPLYLPGWRLVYALQTSTGFQLQSARLMESKALEEIEPAGTHAVLPLTYLGASAVPRMCWRMEGFCLKRDFRWVTARRRRCSSCIRTGPEWSRIAAIIRRPLQARGGAENS